MCAESGFELVCLNDYIRFVKLTSGRWMCISEYLRYHRFYDYYDIKSSDVRGGCDVPIRPLLICISS